MEEKLVWARYSFPHQVYPKTSCESTQYFVLDEEGVRAQLKQYMGWRKIIGKIQSVRKQHIRDYRMINR